MRTADIQIDRRADDQAPELAGWRVVGGGDLRAATADHLFRGPRRRDRARQPGAGHHV
jgi:hypothetical protein